MNGGHIDGLYRTPIKFTSMVVDRGLDSECSVSSFARISPTPAFATWKESHQECGSVRMMKPRTTTSTEPKFSMARSYTATRSSHTVTSHLHHIASLDRIIRVRCQRRFTIQITWHRFVSLMQFFPHWPSLYQQLQAWPCQSKKWEQEREENYVQLPIGCE